MRAGLCIRGATADDATRLAVLATQVWLHTYATDGIDTGIAQYVLATLTPERYAAALQETSTRMLVAEHGEHLVGFAALQFGVPCASAANASAELQTLYVQEHFTGRGIGNALLRSAEAEARERTGSVLWLTVHAHNARAIAFYARQGYVKVGTDFFLLGDRRHENHVLVGRDTVTAA